MMRFGQVVEAHHIPELARIYREMCEAGFGEDVPCEWATTQGSRPDLLNVNWELFKGLWGQGRLAPTLKGLISLSVANENQSPYCEKVWTSVLNGMGVDPRVIEAFRNGQASADLPEGYRTAIAYARKIARDHGTIDDADLEALRQAGLGSDEIMELTMVAAACNYVNTWSKVAGLNDVEPSLCKGVVA